MSVTVKEICLAGERERLAETACVEEGAYPKLSIDGGIRVGMDGIRGIWYAFGK